MHAVRLRAARGSGEPCAVFVDSRCVARFDCSLGALHREDAGMFTRHVAAIMLIALGAGMTVGTALAKDKRPWDDDDRGNHGRDAKQLQARPFVSVDPSNSCGTQPGADIVTSAWLGGMGLADDGVTPTPPPMG